MALAERDVAQPNHSRKDPQEIAQRIILSVGPVRDFTDWKPIELHMWTVHRIRGDGWVGYDRLEPLGLTFKMFRKGQNGLHRLWCRPLAQKPGATRNMPRDPGARVPGVRSSSPHPRVTRPRGSGTM